MDYWNYKRSNNKITGELATNCRIAKERQYREDLKDANIDLIKEPKNFLIN